MLYTFPAIRGRQGTHDYYLIQCPLRLLSRLFLFDEAEVPATLRRIHTIDQLSVNGWVEYLTTRKDDYVLAPLIVIVDQTVLFESLGEELPEIGRVQLSMTAQLIVCDGQHRRAALDVVLARDAERGNDPISVMLIPDPQLVRAIDIYLDLHPTQIQPTRSRRVLHDHSALAALVRQLVDELPLFQGLTEREKTTISNRSTALFTLSAIYQATQALLAIGAKAPVSAEDATLAHDFWYALGEIIPEWRQAIKREMSAATLRQTYVHAHTVTLLAIGMAGRALITAHPADWQERIKVLGAVDWSRENRVLWEGRTMVRGKMSKTRDSINLTAIALKRVLGLAVTEREAGLERGLLGG